MRWHDLPYVIDNWVEKVAALGYDVRQSAANVITASHIGYCCNPDTSQIGIFGPLASPADLAPTGFSIGEPAGNPSPPFRTLHYAGDNSSSTSKVEA